MAAHVLEAELPSLTPSGAPGGDYEQIQATPAMFGALKGQALEKFGGGLEKAGSALADAAESRALLNDEVSANDSSVTGMQGYTKLWSDFGKIQGRASQDALPQFQKDIEETYQKTVESAPNLKIKAMLSRSMRSMADYYQRVGQSHADQQFVTWQNRSAVDAAGEWGNQAALIASSDQPDWAQFDKTLYAAGDSYRKLAQQNGYGVTEQDAEVRRHIGPLLAKIIMTKGDADPNAAADMLDKYKEQMDPGSRLQVVNKLKPMLQQRQFEIGGAIALGREPEQASFDHGERGAGVTPGYTARVIHLESGGNPNAQSGRYGGLAQFDDAGNKKYGITDPGNPTQAANALIAEAGENRPQLRAVLGREPTAAELYMAHQQGAGGAMAQLKNPERPAWQNMASTAEGRAKGDNWAKQAIWGNMTPAMKAQFPGGVETVAGGQFIDMWRLRYNRGGADVPVTDKAAAYQRADQLFGSNPVLWRGVRAVIDREINYQNTVFAERRGQLEKQVPDIIVATQDGNTNLSLPLDLGVLGQGRAEQIASQFEVAKQIGQYRQQLQWASPDEVTSIQRDLEGGLGTVSEKIRTHAKTASTGPGTAGIESDADTAEFYRQRKQGSEAFNKAADDRNRVLVGENADPASYVARHPVVAHAAAAIDPHNPQSFADYATASLALQDHLGVPPLAQHVLTRGQSLKIGEALSAPGVDAKQQMDALQHQFGDAWPQIFRDLVTLGKLPASYQAIGMLDNPRDGALLARWLREAPKDKETTDILPPKVANDIKTAVRTDPGVQQLARSLSASGGSREQVASIVTAVEQLGYAKSYFENDASAASNAIAAFTSQYEFMSHGGARVPAKVYDTVRANAAELLSGLDTAKIAIPEIYGKPGRPKPEEYVDMVKANPTWITSPKADALWLMDTTSQGSRIVRDRQGQPVSVPFAATLSPRATLNFPADTSMVPGFTGMGR